MRKFSIRELESFSGIKAHTIRVWEQRYNVLVPSRTSGNIRFYSLEDVELILNLSLLNNYGIGISKLVKLSDAEINSRITSLDNEILLQQKALNRLIICMFLSEIEYFEDTLDKCVTNFGIDKTIQNIIIPFLKRVNILSYSDTSNEAHLVVCAVRKKLMMAIESCASLPKSNKTALLFLPKGEHYDLMLLYICYAIKLKGHKVIYLGTNILKENLIQVCSLKNPDYLVTYSVSKNSQVHIDYRKFLASISIQNYCVVTSEQIVSSIISDAFDCFLSDVHSNQEKSKLAIA